MTYENAWYNVKQGRSIPYKKETLAKIRELIDQKPHVDKTRFYECFCDSFASNGAGKAYVYHDGKYVDIYDEGKLESREVITHEQYLAEYRAFISRQTTNIKEDNT